MSDREKSAEFTEQVRNVLSYAREEVEHFQHNYMGTEHLLLGLMREDKGIAAKVLKDLGIKLDKVRQTVEAIMGRGDSVTPGERELTPRARIVIELAVNEARNLKHDFVGTEHLLLGLAQEENAIAAGVLESLGVSLEKVRAETLFVLRQSSIITEPQDTPSGPQGEASSPLRHGMIIMEPQDTPLGSQGEASSPLRHGMMIMETQDTPSGPQEATPLVAEKDSVLPCHVCGSLGPDYANYCFHCGTQLRPKEQEL